MNSNVVLNKLKQSGFNVIKSNREYTTLKSNNGIALSYTDGTVEGFVKSKIKESVYNESKLRHGLELVLLIGLGITYFNTDITIVDGVSMEPTYKNLQMIIKTKSATDVNKILVSRESVVKFISPDGDTSIKRVVGVPGDEIEFDFNVVKINGVVVDKFNSEPHPASNFQKTAYTPGGKVRNFPIDVIKLKSNEYFVMGDNASNSEDSRKYGPIYDTTILSIIRK